MLSDTAIRAALSHDDANMRLVVCPMLDTGQIGSASIDLRLGTEFMEVQRTQQGVRDPFSVHDEQGFNVAFGNQLIIHPGQFLLGSTLEYLRVPRQLAGQVLNRSSWARNGLLVATAASVHPGFTGALTLELVNGGTVPLKLVTGTRICQLVLWELDQETSQPYPDSAKYDTSLGPQPSKACPRGRGTRPDCCRRGSAPGSSPESKRNRLKWRMSAHQRVLRVRRMPEMQRLICRCRS